MCVEFFAGDFAFTVKIVGKLKFFGQFDTFLVVVDPFLLCAELSYNAFSFPGIVPEIGGECFLFLVRYFDLLGINVKDTSSAHQGAP